MGLQAAWPPWCRCSLQCVTPGLCRCQGHRDHRLPGGKVVPGDTTRVVACLDLQVLLQIELCVCHPWGWFLQSCSCGSWAVLCLFLTLSLCPQISYLPFTEAFERAQAEKKLVHSILLWGALDDQSC